MRERALPVHFNAQSAELNDRSAWTYAIGDAVSFLGAAHRIAAPAQAEMTKAARTLSFTVFKMSPSKADAAMKIDIVKPTSARLPAPRTWI